MGAAAGAGVRLGEGDDAHLTGQRLFAPIVQGLQLFRRGVGDLDRQVLPDDFIGLLLHLLEQFRGQFHVKVDDNGVIPHVKAHIIGPRAAVENAADDVLPRVILHEGEAPVPIQGAGDLGAHLQGRIGQVDDILPALLGIGHVHAAQDPSVAGLAAAFGIKGGLVQDHFVPLLFPGLAVQDGGLEGMAAHVGVENAFGHGGGPPLRLSFASF